MHNFRFVNSNLMEIYYNIDIIKNFMQVDYVKIKIIYDDAGF